MLFSMAPAAFAAPASEEESGLLTVSNADAVFADEIIKAEDDDSQAEIANEEALDPLVKTRRLRAEAHAEEEASRAPAPGDMLDEDTIELFASSYTVTVKVSFPQAATEDASLFVYLYAPAKVDSTGFVTEAPYIYKSVEVQVEDGARSATATLSVPSGDYIPAVYTYSPTFGSYFYQYLYFNKDGTLASNAYTAEPISISKKTTVNIDMPKAERTISGTVQFSKALTEKTRFEVAVEDDSSYSGSYSYCYYDVAKGAKSFSFSIPVSAAAYTLEIYNYSTGKWGYYDITGGLSTSWDNRAYVEVFKNSVSGLKINADSLSSTESDSEQTEASKVNVTVKLPETMNGYKRYMVLLYAPQDKEVCEYYSCSISSGSSADNISSSFWLQEGMKYSVGYLDVTNYSSFSWTDEYPGARYLTADGSITSNPDNAKVYTMGTETVDITIDDTSNYKLNGTLKLGSAKGYDSAAFAMAEFSNDEAFGARVYFPAGTTSKDYSIYVPKTQSGTFSHWAAEAAGGRGVLLNEDTRVDGNSYTVKNNLSLNTITMQAIAPNVKGTVSLPDGMTAPEGGLALRFYVNNNSVGYYYMKEGKSSLNFSFAEKLNEQNSKNRVRVVVQNAPDNLTDTVTLYGKENGDMTGLEIVIPGTVILSGTISVSDAAKNGGTTFEVYSWGRPEGYSSIGNDTYITVLPGKTTADYELKVLKGIETQTYISVSADATGKVLSTEQYLQEDGSFDKEYAQTELNKDTNASVSFGEGKTISGTVSVAKELGAYDYYGRVYAEPKNGGEEYSVYFSFTGTSADYALAVPADYTGEWRVSVSLYEGPPSAMTDVWLYYSTSGTTPIYSKATPISAPAEDIDFVIPKAYEISGMVYLPDAFYDYYIWGNVCAIDEDYNRYSSYFDTEDSMNYSIKVPVDYDGTYKLAVWLRAGEDVPGLITDSYLYLTEDGTLSGSESDAQEFSVDEDGLYQNLTVPEGKAFNVTLKAPEGFSGYYDGRLYMYDLDTYSSVSQKNFEFEGTSTTISVSMPANNEANYTLELYMDAGPGVVTHTWYYYNSESGTWVTQTNDASAMDFSADGITITMPKAKTIKGKLVSAQGDVVSVRENAVSFSLYQKGVNGDSYVNTRSTIDTEGNFTVTVANELTGKFRLYCYPSGGAGTNVISKSYYYNSTANTPQESYNSQDDTFYFELGEEDISGLELYVNTGYVMSGTVQLGQGATLTGLSDEDYGYVDVTLQAEQKSYSGNTYLKTDDTSWTYYIVVPKTQMTYKLSSRVSLWDSTSSNLYTGQVEHTTVDVNGSATLPTITLEPAKHTVDVKLTSPSNNDVSGYLRLQTGDGTSAKIYEKYFQLSAKESKAFQIMTAPNEIAETYKLFYYLYYEEDMVSYESLYVAADGTLTNNQDNAANFAFADGKEHSITLKELPPFVAGKIYIPDDVDVQSEPFTIKLSCYNSLEIEVSSDTIQTAPDGRQYVTYTAYNSYVDPGQTFKISYNLDGYDGSVLYESWSNYVDEDGEILFDWSNAPYFTVPESGTLIQDFTLATWYDDADENVLQSAHGIDESTGTLTYTYTYPGATSLGVTFHERTDTDLTINGEEYYAHNLSGYTKNIDVSATNGTLTIEITHDGSDLVYGFGIVSIVPYYGEPWVTEPTIASVYSEGGSSEEIVMSDLLDGKNVYVSMVAPENVTSGVLIAAIYDENDKLVDVYVADMAFNDCGNAAQMLEYETVEGAETIRIMFLNDDWVPQMVCEAVGSAS